jgi:hypothetical protein
MPQGVCSGTPPPEPVQLAPGRGLQQHVGRGNERAELVAVGLLVQIEHERALATVVLPEEQGALGIVPIFVEGPDAACGAAAGGSTLMTSAPNPANTSPQYSACSSASSMTLRQVSAPGLGGLVLCTARSSCASMVTLPSVPGTPAALSSRGEDTAMPVWPAPRHMPRTMSSCVGIVTLFFSTSTRLPDAPGRRLTLLPAGVIVPAPLILRPAARLPTGAKVRITAWRYPIPGTPGPLPLAPAEAPHRESHHENS